MSEPSGPQNGPGFGIRWLQIVISYNELTLEQGGPCPNMTGVLIGGGQERTWPCGDEEEIRVGHLQAKGCPALVQDHSWEWQGAQHLDLVPLTSGTVQNQLLWV